MIQKMRWWNGTYTHFSAPIRITFSLFMLRFLTLKSVKAKLWLTHIKREKRQRWIKTGQFIVFAWMKFSYKYYWFLQSIVSIVCWKNWFLSILVDFCQFWSILINFELIFVDFGQFLLIFVNFGWFLPIFQQTQCQILKSFLLWIFVEVHKEMCES